MNPALVDGIIYLMRDLHSDLNNYTRPAN